MARRIVGAVLLAAAAAGGQEGGQTPPPPAAKPEDLPPVVPAGAQQAPQDDGSDVVARDYYFISRDLIRNKDGTLTWFYETNHVGAVALQKSVDDLKSPGLVTRLRQRDVFDFGFQSRKDGGASKTENAPGRKVAADENVLILT
ncbi:MAG: hypothetical protein ACHQ1G_07135, partial [Planctomycetota bacterium]